MYHATDFEFEFPIKRDGHVVAIVEAAAYIAVVGDFDFVPYKLLVKDQETGNWFQVGMETPFGQELQAHLRERKVDLEIEQQILMEVEAA